MRQVSRLIVLITLLLHIGSLWGKTPEGVNSADIPISFQDSLDWADYYFNIHRYKKAIPIYEKNLGTTDKDQQIHIFKKLALSEAAEENPDKAVSYIYDYFKINFQPNFLMHEGFDDIRTTENFKKISGTVLPRINTWSIIYFFVGIIGFYVMFVLLINKKIDEQARNLIAFFVFIHSLFILNICINNTNYVFQFPHTYLMSAWSAFLYGPLLYLYFRRVSQSKDFSLKDLWHFLPTLILVIYLLIEVYSLSGTQKVSLMLERLQGGLNPGDSAKLLPLVTLKAISLAVYAYFVHLTISKSNGELTKRTRIWQRNIYRIHVGYVVAYILFGILIIMGKNSGFFYHAPIVMMSLMVLYVGYAANVQPDVFSGLYAYTNQLFPKYVKSGLTDSLSMELKEVLHDLFHNQKLYLRNDISLDMVAEKLDTTRHNASQLINEHFEMNFHEFVNTFRIKEAKKLLEEQNELNIIDIAYEVGFNNKVSFNKAFKKDTDLTPSQYLNNIRKQ
ncbi:AraC-type DNA-binding protein [Flagellimonas taeanensis]|uniref:AraC-type DNA-binding protein n=1 Tax=Flagellimonas taeanensis TaxID=1005926 RepID=A0A1M6P5T9_9FLAO|nr:helix-turn-helix domain-containing protein [Allomuricauda taeanensis]SFB66347.1 AraC-type DNA-binding protein [Allomuricauda taeanensis]SHK03270.1 transcriptional regulator, AraC family [Allomuricauda taeanensis]